MTFEVQQKDVAIRSEIGLKIVAMLERKREIDVRNDTANRMASYDAWLVDAVEMLLRLELLRRQTYDAPLQEEQGHA